ncbi:MAG: hypothetical protein IPJ34_25830 [Myxococcales bacterium]|nr:hypothetical protein [Myxococcales bacterium]
MIRMSNALVAAAVSGILVGVTGCASSPAPAANNGAAMSGGSSAMPVAKHACKGMNACKGQGGCKVEGKNACKGQNDCKGQGGCKTDA